MDTTEPSGVQNEQPVKNETEPRALPSAQVDRIDKFLTKAQEALEDKSKSRPERIEKNRRFLEKVKRIASGEFTMDEDEARDILGEKMVGSQVVKRVFELDHDIEVPELKLSNGQEITEEMLGWAKANDMALVLRYPTTLKDLVENISQKKPVKNHIGGDLFDPQIRTFSGSELYDRATFDRLHWALVSTKGVKVNLNPPEFLNLPDPSSPSALEIAYDSLLITANTDLFANRMFIKDRSVQVVIDNQGSSKSYVFGKNAARGLMLNKMNLNDRSLARTYYQFPQYK